jgi:hypothetical protein
VAEEKRYYPRAVVTSIKIRGGKRIIDKEGNIGYDPAIRAKITRPEKAYIGLTIKDIALIACRKYPNLEMDAKLEKDTEAAVLNMKHAFATSESHAISLASGRRGIGNVKTPEEVDTLSKQVAEMRSKLEEQAKESADKNSEIADLKSKLAAVKK